METNNQLPEQHIKVSEQFTNTPTAPDLGDISISGFLLNTVTWDSGKNTYNSIEAFQKIVKHIMDLGEAEHSSDWDPYLTIQMKTHSLPIRTASHYPEFEIKYKGTAKYIQVTMDEEDYHGSDHGAETRRYYEKVGIIDPPVFGADTWELYLPLDNIHDISIDR